MSFQKWSNSPIDEDIESSLPSPSCSSQILYDTKLPIYLKCFVNVKNPSETVILFVSFASSYDVSTRCLLCLLLSFFASMETLEELMLTE